MNESNNLSNEIKVKNASKNQSQGEKEIKVNNSQNEENKSNMDKKAINNETSDDLRFLDEKDKENYIEKNEEKKNEENNLNEEKKKSKDQKNHQNQKSPTIPINPKSAKMKQNSQSSEIESVKFSFQSSLSKIAKNETREIGMKEIKEIITKNNTIDFLKIFISVLSSGLKPNYPTEKESRIVIMGWLAEIFQDKIGEASIDKRMVEIILTYFDDKSPTIKFVSSNTLLKIFEHSSQPIETIYKPLIEKINSNVSAQASTIYCLCELIKNESKEKLLEKLYMDVPDLFRKKSDAIPDLIKLFGVLLQNGDYAKFGFNKTKIFLDRFLILLQKYVGMNNLPQIKIDICESLSTLADNMQKYQDETKDIQQQIELLIKKIEELYRDKDLNVRKCASSCILLLKKNLKINSEDQNKTPEKNTKFISNLNNVRFLMKLKNNPRSQTKSTNQATRDVSNLNHLNKKETSPDQISPKKNIFEINEKNLKILKEMIQKSMEKLPKTPKASEENYERNSFDIILDKEPNENKFKSEKSNNGKGKNNENLQNKILNDDLNNINNDKISQLKNMKEKKKEQKFVLKEKMDFENMKELKTEITPTKDIFSDFPVFDCANLYFPKKSINPPQFHSDFYNNIEFKLSEIVSERNNLSLTPPVISDWKKILNILSYKNYDLAFKQTLKMGDDIFLLRLLKLTKNNLGFVSPKTIKKIIIKLEKIQRSSFLDAFFIRMMDDAQKEGISTQNENEYYY